MERSIEQRTTPLVTLCHSRVTSMTGNLPDPISPAANHAAACEASQPHSGPPATGAHCLAPDVGLAVAGGGAPSPGGRVCDGRGGGGVRSGDPPFRTSGRASATLVACMRSVTVVLWLLVLAASTAADDPRIEGLHISREGDRVLASFALQDAFDQRLESRLESGLPTSILYRLELHRDRKRWYDRRLEENTLEVVAVYDAVARTYTIHYKLDDKLIESRTVRERQEV